MTSKFTIQLTDEQIARLTLTDIEYLFKKAADGGYLDNFSDHFWSKFSSMQQITPSLQEVIYELENYKRNIGKHYDQTRKIEAFVRYNKLETVIRWLKNEYNLTRKHKDYYLKLPEWVNNHKK